MSAADRFSVAGKRALVTGASSGLGLHFAKVLAEAGAHVTLAARRVEKLAQVAAEIGGSCDTLALDVTDAASIEAAAPAFAETDILVNNAGVVADGPAIDMSEADWDQVVDTNLKGVFLVAQAAARGMKAHGRGGSIVNVASILGLRQAGGVASYAASKAGVIQLTKVLALEFARFKIRVNALAPGYFETDLNDAFLSGDLGQAMMKRVPQRRFGSLADLDGPLLLLASDAGAYMTGSTLVVDGGHLTSTL
ncbi:SDR family NAD(P)-dependent oxidoreductase [Novosphingobium sp. JCM 18896]|uniref:SDR family NAD(P)-dependent oxidoreductase n=1 Tax=Novosphingobium sp. JCM 18896 TaxID=2989731 RepID=UPI0022229C0F|nr:SDR family NAD(P)-dependent oxidoreductase [Novosphingobium sp. JCM 18896]MCW1427530.1 SDR family oxidoreductase [Novosphingobium sp. JCM 18896]